MTFLQLVQAFVREADLGPPGRPTTVINQSGELSQSVHWVREAWIELQSRHEWRWMRRTYALDLVEGQEIYTIEDAHDVGYISNAQLITLDLSTRPRISESFGTWYSGPYDLVTLLPRHLNSGRQLTALPWEEFRSTRELATNVTGDPTNYSVDPIEQLHFYPSPDGDDYRVFGEYKIDAQSLERDDDVPSLPRRFHQLIVYTALTMYGQQQNSPEIVEYGRTRENKLTRQLEQDQLPATQVAGPLI